MDEPEQDQLTISEGIYSFGISVISYLQETFPNSENVFVDISIVFDPKYVFTLYFPILYAFHWAIGVKILGTIIVVEWLNQLLKWLMHGDRPYWWVHEMEEHHRLSKPLPEIHQFESTCETGPGMPSGHSMAMSATWYVIVHAVIEHVIEPSNMSETLKKESRQLLWVLYFLIQALVIVSRMYIAAHFPHQCFLGLALGFTLAKIVFSSSKWLTLNRIQWLLVSALIFLSANGLYWILSLVGDDPAWSISEAKRWCDKPEYIHVDTMPFYSLMRYSGAAFGLGLGLTSKYFKDVERSSFTVYQTILTIILGCSCGYLTDWGHHLIPKTSIYVFYPLEFVINSILPYATIALVPYVVSSLSTPTKTKSS